MQKRIVLAVAAAVIITMLASGGYLYAETNDAREISSLNLLAARKFDERVKDISIARPVVVYMWKPGCGSCTRMGRLLKSADRVRAGDVDLIRMNVSRYPTLKKRMFAGRKPPAAVAIYRYRRLPDFLGRSANLKDINEFIENVLFMHEIFGPANVLDLVTNKDIQSVTG